MMETKSSRKVMLSEDILELSVLPRLPAKSLIRFKCVSKRWYDLITNSQFFILQQYRSCTANSSLFSAFKMPGSIFRDQNSVGIPIFSRHFKGFVMFPIASCNGLVAVYSRHRIMNLHGLYMGNLYVGNPVLQDWKLIPKPAKLCIEQVGLAFDPAISVRYFELVCPYLINGSIDFATGIEECGFMVFSSKTGEWKMSKSKVFLHIPSIEGNTIFLNGNLYWRVGASVLWFDTKRDCNGLIPLPLPMGTLGSQTGCLNGSDRGLTFTTIVNFEIEIWSMKEQQWFKMYHIRIEEIVRRSPDAFASLCHQMHLRNRKPFDLITRQYDAIPTAFEGKVVFFMLNYMGFGYDVESGEATIYPGSSSWPKSWFPYKSNLIPLPGKS